MKKINIINVATYETSNSRFGYELIQLNYLIDSDKYEYLTMVNDFMAFGGLDYSLILEGFTTEKDLMLGALNKFKEEEEVNKCQALVDIHKALINDFKEFKKEE